jgi:hypothetical protein
MLDHDRLLERQRPEHRSPEARVLPDQVEHPLLRKLRDGRFRDRDDRMIRLRQQKAAQAEKITGHGEVDDLPPPVRQQLRTRCPALQQHEVALAFAVLRDEFGARRHRPLLFLQSGDAGDVLGGEVQKVAELARQRALLGLVVHASRPLLRLVLDTVVVEVSDVELRELPQPRKVVDRELAPIQRDQAALTQLSQNPVDVNRGEPDRIGERF